MSLSELLEKRKNISFQIKSLLLRLKEIRESYLPSQGDNIGSKTKSASSPQERIILRMDKIYEQIDKHQEELEEIDKLIDVKLLMIGNPKYRWITLQRLKGVAWKEIDGYGLTISRLKHIFRESCKILNIVWQD